MTTTRRRAPGFTLVELMVTLTVLGIVFATVGLAPLALTAPDEAALPRQVHGARRDAIRSGQPVALTLDPAVTVMFFPDGSATPAHVWDGEAHWTIDPWTGEARRD
ncbi:MAG TPA: prepilin-type N-terminal cleavage/methylation domain-containing protein [Gemmatimonadales bacterium]